MLIGRLSLKTIYLCDSIITTRSNKSQLENANEAGADTVVQFYQTKTICWYDKKNVSTIVSCFVLMLSSGFDLRTGNRCLGSNVENQIGMEVERTFFLYHLWRFFLDIFLQSNQ